MLSEEQVIRTLSSVVLLSVLVAALSPDFLRADEPLRIATFQADVTPPVGSVLCFGGVAPVKEIVDPLSARGLVFLVKPSPVVLCAVDWVEINNEAHDAWREELAKAAGTSPDRVAVQCVHQHDAPGCDFGVEALLKPRGLGGATIDPDWARAAMAKTAAAVRQAMKTPHVITHLGMGKAKVEQVASNRRILGPDGKVNHTRMSRCPDRTVRDLPEGLIDPFVRVLSLRNGDQPLVCLNYYATHPQCHYNQGGVSADFVGMARTMREKDLPRVVQIYFTGAGGNIAVGKYNDGAISNRPILARRLADGMKAAFEATKWVPIAADDVGWQVRTVALPPSPRLDESKLMKVLDDAGAKKDQRVLAAIELAWLRRIKAGRQLEISCLRLGPAYVLNMPGELFVEYQLAAERIQPDSMVCMAAYGDCGPGYVGTEIAYSQGGYETSYVSRVAPSTETLLMEAIRELLR